LTKILKKPLFLCCHFLYGSIIFFRIGVDLTEYFQKTDINIPVWYFYLIFAVDIIGLLSIVGIYFYRKIGVILFPVAILFHFYLHEFYLSTMLYSDLFTLFSYVALGLLAIIPKWNFFK
jgi:hypothetical protein